MASLAMEQGMAAVRAQSPYAAADWFRRELAANPGNLEASAWLGQSLCVMGHMVEGRAQLRSAASGLLDIARGPDAAFARAIEAITGLQQWGDMEGALPLSRRAAELAPGDPAGRRVLAITYGQLNMTDEALAAGEAALSLSADPMMQVLQASLEIDARRHEPAVARLQAVLSGRPEPRVAFRAHKEMARALDGLKRFDEVFPHLEAAAAIAPQLLEFRRHDPGAVPRLLEANHRDYSPDLLSRFAGAAFKTRAPAFIMGFYRSGTTLTQAVLDTHADAFVADEAHMVGDVQRELLRLSEDGTMAERLAGLTLAQVEHLRAFYWERVRLRYGEAAAEAPVFIDKFTMNTLDLGVINTLFPDAQVVFMLRDPRDAVLSAALQLMPPSAATIHLLTWPGAAALYAEVMDWWLTVRPMLTMRVHEVRYENAVKAFEPTFRPVFEALGLTWTGEAAAFNEAAAGRFIASPSRSQVTRALYGTAVARWRNYADRYAAVADFLDPLSEEFGYAVA